MLFTDGALDGHRQAGEPLLQDIIGNAFFHAFYGRFVAKRAGDQKKRRFFSLTPKHR